MVEAIKTPNEIISEYMTYAEKDALIKYLIGYQKSQTDWDAYRKKIPDDFLEKFVGILKECRRNGFINPRAQGNVIVWKQIFSSRRNKVAVDECTLCPMTFVSGECKGKKKWKFKHIMFAPCWESLPGAA